MFNSKLLFLFSSFPLLLSLNVSNYTQTKCYSLAQPIEPKDLTLVETGLTNDSYCGTIMTWPINKNIAANRSVYDQSTFV